MHEEHVMRINEAIRLWHCLASIYDTFCIITFKDYTSTIIDFTARQLLITTWVAGQLAAKVFNRALAREKLEWEANLKGIPDDTGIIPIIDEEEDEVL